MNKRALHLVLRQRFLRETLVPIDYQLNIEGYYQELLIRQTERIKFPSIPVPLNYEVIPLDIEDAVNVWR